MFNYYALLMILTNQVKFSDNYYVATLLHCLAESMVEPQGGINLDFSDLSEETAEIELRRAAQNEISRYQRIDEYIPSYRNLYTRATLFCQKRLMEAKVEPRRLAFFMPYIRPGNLDEVRLAAFEALIELGMLRKPSFMQCALRLFSTEPSPFLRNHFWSLIERGFGLIALGEPEAEVQPISNGFVIAEGESAEVRQERAERTGSLEGALRSFQRRLANDEVLQEALMDALRYVTHFLNLRGRSAN
jgi:transcription initiation factor TFIID subunit 2